MHLTLVDSEEKHDKHFEAFSRQNQPKIAFEANTIDLSFWVL